MTRLQIDVELNEKDGGDTHALLITHDVGRFDDDEMNASWIAAVCAGDSGLHHTAFRTLDRLGQDTPRGKLTAERRSFVDDRLAKLRRANEDSKSMSWRIRATVGECTGWYDEPEEI